MSIYKCRIEYTRSLHCDFITTRYNYSVMLFITFMNYNSKNNWNVLQHFFIVAFNRPRTDYILIGVNRSSYSSSSCDEGMGISERNTRCVLFQTWLFLRHKTDISVSMSILLFTQERTKHSPYEEGRRHTVSYFNGQTKNETNDI
jgi:hypothetical protein